MDKTDNRDPRRYFWTGWFIDQPYRVLAGVFVLLSLADLSATLHLLRSGAIQEGNALALTILRLYGPAGMAAYKVALVLVILTLGWLIDRKDHRLSQIVMWSASVLMGYIALRQLAAIAYALL
ncbi:MAG TPA: DUF5658 family protein [Armatimonadota bacterium]